MRPNLQILILSLSLIFIGSSITSSAASAYSIHLKSGDIETRVLSASELENTDTDASFNGQYYMLMQFHNIPTKADIQHLNAAGVKLLQYIPRKAYFASIQSTTDFKVLNKLDVRWMAAISAEMKKGKYLTSGDLPTWATNSSNEVLLNVQLFEGVSFDAVTNQINSIAQINGEYIPSIRKFNVLLGQDDINAFLSLPFIQYAEVISAPSTKDDQFARALHRSSTVNQDNGVGRKYDGEGVSIAVADDGLVGPHIDYTGRITQYTTTSSGSHGDMTTGIAMGAGNLDPDMRGHATAASLHYYSITGYPQVTSAVTNLTNNGVVVTSTSYSQGQGGTYTSDAEYIDDQVFNNDAILHVFSAGNSGASDHGYGAGAGWGNITGGYKAAKNVIASGNLDKNAILESSSSRGPADDGRVKPDVSANGHNQMSTSEENTYQVGGGTSAAAPSIAGISTQLYHAYRIANGGNNPQSSLIKGIILNTAEDLGRDGPDFEHGWGVINALRAVRAIENVTYQDNSVDNGDTTILTWNVKDGTTRLKAMLYWLDPEASSSASKALINDLDLLIIDPNGDTSKPLVLDYRPNTNSLTTVAYQGKDSVNNMEQIVILDPDTGIYTMLVIGYEVPQGPQAFHMIYDAFEDSLELAYPFGGESFTPGDVEMIRWNAVGNGSLFRLQYSTDGGSNWTNISSTIVPTSRTFDWTIPNVRSGNVLVRIIRDGSISMTKDPINIIREPINITIPFSCPDSMQVSWNGVNGATAYEISMLGNKFMDSVARSTSTSIVIPINDPMVTRWVSVKALDSTTNAIGKRAIAIEKTPGVWNCIIPKDIGIVSILSPPAGELTTCALEETTPITIEIMNGGTVDATGFTVRYNFNNQGWLAETFTDTLAAGQSTEFTFTNTVNLQSIGNYPLSVLVDYTGDANSFNDDSSQVTSMLSASAVSVPLEENFDFWTNCATTLNCGGTFCQLQNGWTNLGNGTFDDHDWRVHNGATASNNTGPSVDHTTNSTQGRYIYLEASQCYEMTAIMVSPCLDLAGHSEAQLSFWYHMLGNNMGDLHIDILANGRWTEDVQIISGNQGSEWKQSKIDISDYTGGVINVRFRGIVGNFAYSDISIDDVNIKVAPVADFTHTSTGNGLVVNYKSTSISADSLAWFLGQGGVSSDTTPTGIIYPIDGIYTITLIAYNDVGSDTMVKQVHVSTVGISDIANAEFNVFPNPTTDLIQLKASGFFSENELQLEVRNIQGKLLMNEGIILNGGSFNNVIDMSPYSNGIYYIKLKGHSTSLIKKVTKL